MIQIVDQNSIDRSKWDDYVENHQYGTIMNSCYVEDKAREANLKIAIDQTIAQNGVLVLSWHSNTWHPDEYKDYQRFYVDLLIRLKDQRAEFNTLNGFYLEQIKERQEPQTEEKSEQI